MAEHAEAQKIGRQIALGAVVAGIIFSWVLSLVLLKSSTIFSGLLELNNPRVLCIWLGLLGILGLGWWGGGIIGGIINKRSSLMVALLSGVALAFLAALLPTFIASTAFALVAKDKHVIALAIVVTATVAWVGGLPMLVLGGGCGLMIRNKLLQAE